MNVKLLTFLTQKMIKNITFWLYISLYFAVLFLQSRIFTYFASNFHFRQNTMDDDNSSSQAATKKKNFDRCSAHCCDENIEKFNLKSKLNCQRF